ncbi:MAG: glucose-1-phosphate adenylyltransferase subunit GlgD [Dorea formicigenerans]|nr:glucose-1-phosphate adenylyltransferase subunit GlgD [Dorea formicigenerans]
MINANADAMGIIFPNNYDKFVPELVSERLMASIPFASRYRMIDFLLSSMVGCGIDKIEVLVRENYHSLVDHLGGGREWDLSRKNGGLSIFPPFAQKSIGSMGGGRVEALANILPVLKKQKEKYVIMADTNIAANFDFNALIAQHVKTDADITFAYTKEELPQELTGAKDASKGLYYTLKLDGDKVEDIYINKQEQGVQNFSMNIYIANREWLIDTINAAFMRGAISLERDILIPHLDTYKVMAYEHKGYVARITGLKSYFDENMKLLDDKNLEKLFTGNPIYTKIRDDNPTRYIGNAKASNVMVADGCVIEGEVENSILFRGAKIAKGAKVKNCVLMQDTIVGEGTKLEYIISDKNVKITDGKELKGDEAFPVFVAKGQVV